MSALVAPPARAFEAEVLEVGERVRERMRGTSWRDDPRCPAFETLRYLRIAHVTMDGGVGTGELVVAARIAARAVALFRRLYAIGFPVRGMRLVDDFGASDDASMSADNSSAFNFRVVAGTGTLSQHALGRAIDINPVENPWRKPDKLLPPEGAAFADRANVRPGMIVRPGPVVAAFDEMGWEWGGDWRHAFDDHHIVWSREA